jgi:hypothetical protein
MDIKEDVIRLGEAFHKLRAERDVIHKVPIHHVTMQPVGPGSDGTGTFVRQTAPIRREQGGSDDAGSAGMMDHG